MESLRQKSKYLYYLDLGKAEVNSHPTYERSKVGIISSIVIIIIVAFFIIVTIAQFSKGVPSIIYNADNPSTYQPLMTPVVGIVLKRGNTPVALDPTMLNITFRYMTITEQDKFPRKIEYIKAVKCTFYDNPLPGDARVSVYTEESYCPERPVQMTGSYDMNTYQYMDIAVSQCECQPGDINCKCASDDDFKNYYFNDTAINLLIIENIPSYSVFPRRFNIFPLSPDFSKPPTVKNYTRSLFWYTSKYMYQKVDVSIKRKTIFNAPRFMFDYDFGYFYSLGDVNARTADYDSNSTLLFKAYISLSDYENNEFRQGQPFLNLIGSWGALWTFFSLTILNLVSLYNKKKYDRNKQLREMVQHVMKSNSSTEIEMDLHSKNSEQPKNILNSSSTQSLENLGWSHMSHFNSSFTLTNTSNAMSPNGTLNSNNAPNLEVSNRTEDNNNINISQNQ